ncbi:MAG: methyltransferase domain-containing protein [Rhizobiaceae bacterium]
MHNSSYKKAEYFLSTYFNNDSVLKKNVLEVGSKSYHSQDTYRNLFNEENYIYTGLDIESGNNVDYVPENIFIWSELEDNSFDIIISGQTFEHNPYFWVTFLEIARVLKPGGYAFICAPGGGKVHRYPVDCWRFYPDSWSALCQFAGLNLIESYFEPDSHIGLIGDAKWRDSAAIAQKPNLSGDALKTFNDNIKNVTKSLSDRVYFKKEDIFHRKWVKEYEKSIKRGGFKSLIAVIRRKMAGSHVKIYK